MQGDWPRTRLLVSSQFVWKYLCWMVVHSLNTYFLKLYVHSNYRVSQLESNLTCLPRCLPHCASAITVLASANGKWSDISSTQFPKKGSVHSEHFTSPWNSVMTYFKPKLWLPVSPCCSPPKPPTSSLLPSGPSGVQLATVTGGPQRPLKGGQDLLITRQALDFEAGQSRISDLHRKNERPFCWRDRWSTCCARFTGDGDGYYLKCIYTISM